MYTVDTTSPAGQTCSIHINNETYSDDVFDMNSTKCAHDTPL